MMLEAAAFNPLLNLRAPSPVPLEIFQKRAPIVSRRTDAVQGRGARPNG